MARGTKIVWSGYFHARKIAAINGMEAGMALLDLLGMETPGAVAMTDPGKSSISNLACPSPSYLSIILCLDEERDTAR